MLLDDETAPYVVGECLVHLPREEVEEKLQQGARAVLRMCGCLELQCRCSWCCDSCRRC